MNLNEDYLIKRFDEGQNRDYLGLNLTGRGLTEIRSDTLNLKDKSKLDFIDINNNEILKIEENAFHDQENLKDLRLDDNKLIEINRTLFKRLPNLEYLWIDCVLKNNEEAQQDILKMKKLKVLRWFNKGNTLLANIDQLSELIILYPGELDSLSCKISKLKHLKFFTFDGSPNVNTISCKLPESLTYLDINGTSISNIDNIFDLAPNLKGMDMRSTKIKSVSNTCPIEKLQSLTLCNCGIDYSVYRRAKDAGAYCFVSPWCAETEQNWQPDPGD